MSLETSRRLPSTLESVLASPKTSLTVRSKAEFLESLEDAAAALPTVNPRRKVPEVLPPEPRTVEEFADVIGTLFREAEERFVLIGSFLERAKATLPHGEFQGLIASRLPFGPRAAQMMMAAAKAIQSGILPQELAPPSYSIVYQITTLTESERQQAMAEGVIRPDMRRQDIDTFKKRVRSSQGYESDSRRASLERERDRLRRLLEAVERELAALESP